MRYVMRIAGLNIMAYLAYQREGDLRVLYNLKEETMIMAFCLECFL